MKKVYMVSFFIFISISIFSKDGSSLWLNYPSSSHAKIVFEGEKNKTLLLAQNELKSHWLGNQLVVFKKKKDRKLKSNSFKIYNKNKHLVIESVDDVGILYGVYHLLRLQQLGADFRDLNILESPKYDLRILNHWDNLDGTVERGYAGQSLWKWEELPDLVSKRYEEYARANASIGINGTVINNVNASPKILSNEYLDKVSMLASIFRPYGLKIYLSVNFASPSELGGLNTSDPLNKEVISWWKDKVSVIYKKIPDFGGFLVKANSEGLPGPHDYGRTHLDGANMLADAVNTYGGIVMWRAFVYSPEDDDRAKQAYQEFMPFDGYFRENVIIQVKNGPVDFQPREPYSPLFGAMHKSCLMPELQITQEYLGFSNHLAYLSPMWKEFFDTETYSCGEGSTIAKVTDGTLYKHKYSAIAGVTNIGDDINWCGSIFAQANWYAFGRLSWNHELTSEEIAMEWIQQTFTSIGDEYDPILSIMSESREAVVDYMMPLGLHHLFAWGHHYGPEPWCVVDGARPDWLPSYYHKATEYGIGFDRTIDGSNAISQYPIEWKNKYNNPLDCPKDLVLWFHHLPWDYQLDNGEILWDELCFRYDKGVKRVRNFQREWEKMRGKIEESYFLETERKLKIQLRDAIWWKDACLLYFQTFSKKKFPTSIELPIHSLDDLKKYRLDITNYENPPTGLVKYD